MGWQWMLTAPRDGRFIEIQLAVGTAYAFWNGKFWDDGAGYRVDGHRWRPAAKGLPV